MLLLPCCSSVFLKKKILFIFRERGWEGQGEREREREREIY